MKKLFTLFLACCLCLSVFVSCAEVDAREDKMDKRKTFASKEEMLRYLSGAGSRERGITSAGSWIWSPEDTLDSILTSDCTYSFEESGKVTYSEKATGEKTDLTEKVTFVPEKGYIILPNGVKLYCEHAVLIEQKDDDASGSEIREFGMAF